MARAGIEPAPTLDYIRMLYISYGSVCELETQILLAGDLGLIEEGVLGRLKKDIPEIEKILMALIKSLEIFSHFSISKLFTKYRGPFFIKVSSI